MFLRCFVVLVTAVSWLSADEVSLVRVGDAWSYFRGIAEPSTPSTEWRELNFDDSAWAGGRSGFSLGYGIYNDATVLSPLTGRYESAYFRKKFLVSDVAAVKWLILRVDHDDGFAAYLNGVEILRRGLAGEAGSFIPFSATATNVHARWSPEEIDLSSFTNLLQPGDNILAVQVHKAGSNDSTLSFTAELLANFQRGPFVQNASSSSIQIIWRTPVASDSAIEFGLSAALGSLVADTNPVTTHVMTLTNLGPGTTYHYRVRSSADGQTASSSVATFRTLKSSGSINFAVFGDSGLGTVPQYQIAEVTRSLSPDLVLHVGDVIYPQFTIAQSDLKCLSVDGAHMRTTPYYFTMGNHDLYAGDIHYLETFYLPTNTATGTEHFYSFDHGDAHFCSLFMPMRAQNALFPNYSFEEGTAQYAWLTNDLARSTRPWNILFFHIPLNSSGPRRFDWSGFTYDRLEVQRLLLPICERYGVQLVLTGHDHAFERFAPMNGVHAVVTGGGGYLLYPLVERDPASAQFWSRYHCVKVTIDGEWLTLQAIDDAGVVFDSMTIHRSPPPRRVYQAAWHSPLLESKPPDDGDGNINGQRFDFPGEPIPTRTGRFSNLGRVYVSNDRGWLYVGLEQAMFSASNNIFLFIESSLLSGITNLAGIGNGLVDPDAEGVDGLDFLANLAFTNFAPAIACVLGDEFADTSYRSYSRPALALNIGQGIFELDQTLRDVPGARLQQFNRSPQAGAEMGEQNADLIEVAIPLSELGGLQPGDVIKIGAVVGGFSFDTNVDRQTRELDSAFLGYALVGSGQGPVLLEGLSVQLALDPDPDSDGLTTAEENSLGTNPVNPDTDGDGLLDGWEVVNGLDPLASTGGEGATGDPDGDGVSNLQEQTLKSDPRNRDTDGDGLLDGWEVSFGLSPVSAVGSDGPTGDPDNDGFTNAQEQLAGTDPRDSNSALRLSLARLGDNRYRLSWQSVPGKRYELEYARDWPTNFANIATNVFPRVAVTNSESFDDTLALPAPAARYYRVRLIP